MNSRLPSIAIRRLAASEIWICNSCLFRIQSVRAAKAKRKAECDGRRAFSVSRPRNDELSRTAVLPDGPARTRFAPSPTGYLHIGGLRTALFSYLLSRRTGGQFLLRIEDTDQKRLVPGAEHRLLEDLKWAGLSWDEGPEIGGPHGPYKQSERNEIYQRHAWELLDRGAAYRCFCKPQNFGQGTAAYVTSGCYQDCSSLPSEQAMERAEEKKEAFTVRLKRPADVKKRAYPDLVYGKIVPLKRTLASVPSEDSEAGIDAADTILVKSDGTPTYHFANVVDDHLMKITHVIRGSEWMASTPLHYDLYAAFGWTPPTFAHVGLLVDENKHKLSKRNSDLALDVRSMREQHSIVSDALVNFLALQGWSNPLRNDVMTLDDLQEVFDLKFTKGNTMVKFDKLWFLQKKHVARRCNLARSTGILEAIDPVVRQIRDVVGDRGLTFANGIGLYDHCADILLADSKSYQNATQFSERNGYFFDFNSKEVPATPDAYASNGCEIAGAEVEAAVKGLMLDEATIKIFKAAQKREASRDGRLWFDIANESLHGILHGHAVQAARRTLLASVNPDQENDTILDSPLSSEAVHGILSSESEDTMGGDESDEGIAVANSTKAWDTAMSRYLREKLSYGLPGPSIGVVMALLGWEECCRRLGVNPRKDDL